MAFSRRQFILQTTTLVSFCAGTDSVFAAAGPISESDLIARLFSYKMDATSVDKAKHPSYTDGQVCANCRHYKGKATDSSGPCTIFLDKLVNANGWCSLYGKPEH